MDLKNIDRKLKGRPIGVKNLWKIYRLAIAFFFTDLVGKESRPTVPLATTLV
jgi:hypothetical protein